LEPSESGKVVGVKAMVADEKAFDEHIKELDGFLASGDFDIIKNSLRSYAQLFNRFYDHSHRRSIVEEKIKSSWDKMPLLIRMYLLRELAKFALDHEDQDKALKLINEAQSLLDGNQWRPEHYIEQTSKLIDLRFRAGDIEKARSDADSMLALFNKERHRIVNIYRAGALRPLAEAYGSMNDKKTALFVYKKVVEEGITNPNSRPRAEDLSATCCSMALHAVQPDTELLTRIHQIRNRLGPPW
jgi:hypothetical protein